ncbi:MAG: nicotinate-nucleotide adenylyltransferase [Chitinophagaceae bacterium]|nr:nicotinate-nucleotide adenylyltransferase [Chitinophagaceae bacterium]MBK7559336.1 nicotinate-nucleotide adenylyltransferase [Chitinophagaceae bacterium]MBK9532115.1 nicotinate-nucleotide adenylyltransferase [Chitinophagaceae bacterium]HQW91638.1 nicotinate (nicotinamide) nucleotide adenylyltransferase [Ferruginibacter sp.]
MKIGLYFGSFNPVHIGHLIIASHAVNETDLNQVWFVVSPQNPFKQSATLLNEYHRLHLIRSAITGENNLRASAVEFNLPRPSYTIDTLAYLKEKYPGHEFSILMGSDGFQNLHKWKNFEVIVKNHPIIIYKRPGFEIQETHGAVIRLLDAPLLEISSTHIRELIKKKKSIRFLVPDIVKEEIETGAYYRN